MSRSIVLAVVAALSLLQTAPLHGQGALGDLTAYAKNPAKGVIDDIRKAGGALIAQGEAAGNGMITHGGIELDAASRSAILGLGGDIDKAVGDLSVGEQQIILSLLRLQQQVKSLTDTAYDLKDTTVVDLTAWESGWIFAHTPNFFVQSIRGTAFLPQPGAYHVTVTAYGFGESSDSKAEITGKINGNDVKFSELDQTSQRGKAVISLPNDVISPLFATDKLKVVTLNLNVKLSRKKFLHTDVKNYEFPVNLLLYPSQIASVVVTTTAPNYSWVDIGNVDSPVVTTNDTDGCKYCNTNCTSKNSTTVVVPGQHLPLLAGDERIAAGSLECRSDNLCAFTVRTKIDIVENGARANATWEACTHSAQYVLHGQAQQYRQTGTSQTASNVNLTLDNPQVVNLPDGTSLVVVSVTSFTKQKYSLVYPQADPHKIITVDRQAGTSNLVLTAIPPTS